MVQPPLSPSDEDLGSRGAWLLQQTENIRILGLPSLKETHSNSGRIVRTLYNKTKDSLCQAAHTVCSHALLHQIWSKRPSRFSSQGQEVSSCQKPFSVNIMRLVTTQDAILYSSSYYSPPIVLVTSLQLVTIAKSPFLREGFGCFAIFGNRWCNPRHSMKRYGCLFAAHARWLC
jgi:hypothetical protein